MCALPRDASIEDRHSDKACDDGRWECRRWRTENGSHEEGMYSRELVDAQIRRFAAKTGREAGSILALACVLERRAIRDATFSDRSGLCERLSWRLSARGERYALILPTVHEASQLCP
jgi:hypothetical protein